MGYVLRLMIVFSLLIWWQEMRSPASDVQLPRDARLQVAARKAVLTWSVVHNILMGYHSCIAYSVTHCSVDVQAADAALAPCGPVLAKVSPMLFTSDTSRSLLDSDSKK